MFKTTIKLLSALAMLLLFTTTTTNLFSQVKKLDSGAEISWDGTYYDFRDADVNQMIKLWIPPNTETIKGIFISGHGGGSGDSRNFARDENVRAFAMRLGFGVAGLHNFPGRRAYESGGKVFFDALDAFAEMGDHPELANVPFVIYGSSNGGATVYGFVNYAPERAICFVSNVASGDNPKVPVDAALKVPGVFIIGKFDGLAGERGMKNLTELFTNYALPKESLWSWGIELKGHEDGYSFDVYMKMVEQAVKARYPEKADPKKGPVKLNDIKRESGWLVDFESRDDGIVYVAPYTDYKKDKSKAMWVLNKDMAYVYRAMATYHNPISLSVKEFDRTLNTNTDPGTMFSLGGPVVDPDEEINISCDMTKLPDWQKLEFFNGSEKIGEVSAGKEPTIKTTIKGDNQVYCLLAVATDKSGVQKTTSPFHFFVRNPELSWKTEKKLDEFSVKKTNAGSKNAGKKITTIAPNDRDSILVAYGLNADMEKQYSGTDGKVSDFWSQIGEGYDIINMTQRKNAANGATFKRVITNDCNMKVKAAYGADGLYILFEVNDDKDAAWPNKFTGTENEQFYSNFDAVDFLIDSRDIKNISDPAQKMKFVSPHFAFTQTTTQYQVAMGNEEEKPLGLKVSTPDPWDMNAVYWSFVDLAKYKGIQIENVKTDYFFKAQEWFIPWTSLGEDIKSEPDANTRFAFSPGYNDRDEGEHMPPGFDASGGSVKSSNFLRWINSSNPWGASPKRSKAPYNWGEIELGPMIQ